MSETRPDTESVSVPLVAADGLVPQVLKVQFVYFRGRLPWRPILFSALLLGLGNMTGPLVALLARRIGRTLRARVHLGRGGARGRESRVVPSQETLARIRPDENTYDGVVKVCDAGPGEAAQPSARESGTVCYPRAAEGHR